MPRPSNTTERKAQIAGGLIKVMAKRGYDGASIADIAKAAGLTSGLVHYHFKNKHHILMAALRELIARHDANLQRRLVRAGDDPIAGVATYIDVHLGLGADADPEALACWVLLSGEALRDAKVRAELTKSIEAEVMRLTEMIRAGVGQRCFDCDAIGAAASALVATIQGYVVLAATAPGVIPRGSAAVSTKRMADGLLQPTRSFTAKP